MKTVQELLLALRDAHFSDMEIHRRTGIPQPTINRLRSGDHLDTSYQYGKRIEVLLDDVLAGKVRGRR
jgi:hypothetical protein